MKTPKDVFWKVIDLEFYNELNPLMCNSLKSAWLLREITYEEYTTGTQAIKEYLGAYGSLGGYLRHNCHPYEFKDKIEIYKNWDNRPIFSKTKAS